MARKTRALPKTAQKRGCANVLVPREDVLVNGKVPKGCHFVTGGDVLCTPAVAESVGVITVERQKAVRRRGSSTAKRASTTRKRKKKSTTAKSSTSKSSTSSKKYCYGPNSPHPYLKKKLKNGQRKLKKGCKKDRETGKICCDRSVAPKRRRRTGTDGQQRLDLDGVTFESLGLAGVDPRRFVDPVRPGPALAMLDDGDLELAELAEPADLALLDESTALAPLPPEVAIPRREEHLDDFGEFAMMYLAGSLAAGAGLWATYELVDRIEYFDDKPVARAAAFVGAGALPAAALWAVADGEYADQIRTFAAAYGITVTAVGALGIVRSLLEQQAAETTDPDARKSLHDAAEHVPWYPSHADAHDEPTSGGGGTGGSSTSSGEDEIVTDTGSDTEADPGTGSPYPYPHPRARFR